MQTAAGGGLVRDGRAAEECAPEVSGGSGRNLPATRAKTSNTLYRQGNMPETERLLSNVPTINAGEKIHIFQSLHQRSVEVPADKGFERELLPLGPDWGFLTARQGAVYSLCRLWRLAGQRSSLLHDDRRCSGVQSAKFGVTWENQQEVRERFRATILTSREQQAISPVVQQKNIDWKNFDGVGDGERPGVSCTAHDEMAVCELDYDEGSEDLEEVEIPHWKNDWEENECVQNKGCGENAKFVSKDCILQVPNDTKFAKKSQELREGEGRMKGSKWYRTQEAICVQSTSLSVMYNMKDREKLIVVGLHSTVARLYLRL
ncbi:hypothetical protein NDU88_006010 [Pleurodeles waltl]|uniref:Uncharacterized protein n=1 Tax=Pleurodeles waltl TaxID=8319 RepID=A0AAV7QHI3_PLEWA|nr:hypothetical protein NDU88_006010 [Pleurodeles waltl]